MDISKHEQDATPNIQFNMDELDLDLENMDFKPVTEGLGFHHEEKTKKILEKKKPTPRLQKNLTLKKSDFAKPLGISKDNEKSLNTFSSTDKSLSAFYGEDSVEEVSKRLLETAVEPEVAVEKEVEYKNANLFLRTSAWAIDVLFISIAVAMTMGLFVLASGIDYFKIVESVGDLELLSYCGIYFTLIYLAYFTMFDLVASPGKTLMQLMVVSTNRGKVGISQTLFRSIISLLSILLIGLPCLLDFHGRLSDTRVVHNV